MKVKVDMSKLDKNIKLQNLHTHTTYCDGKDSVEEMIIAAYNMGFDSIGFSSHSFMKGQSLSEKIIESYKSEIADLKIKYASKIDVFCGLECEMCGNTNLSGFDYLIGAVHYLKCGEEVFTFDLGNVEDVKQVIERYFGGDGMAYAKTYYRDLGKLSQTGKFDIIAHFDLITKFNEKGQLFDENAKEYRWAAIEAAEQLAEKIPYFEVNTGAIAKGYRTSPYPAVFLLQELKRLGFGAIISSDCHDSKKLTCGLQEAEELLKQCGFKERFILTKNGFVPVEI